MPRRAQLSSEPVYRNERLFLTRRASLNWQGSGLEIHRAARPLGVRIPRPPPLHFAIRSRICRPSRRPRSAAVSAAILDRLARFLCGCRFRFRKARRGTAECHHRRRRLGVVSRERGHLAETGPLVGGGHDRVAPINALGLVPGQAHGHRARDARAFVAPHGSAPEVVGGGGPQGRLSRRPRGWESPGQTQGNPGLRHAYGYLAFRLLQPPS
jgi:hypothetical protein